MLQSSTQAIGGLNGRTRHFSERGDLDEKRVLIAGADDFLGLIEGVEAEGANLQIVRVAQPGDLLAIVKRLKPSLVVVDVALWGDVEIAAELTRGLKREVDEPVPVLAIGADSLRADADTVFRAGADAWLPRPVGRERFAANVRRLLGSPVREHFRVPAGMMARYENGEVEEEGRVRDLSEGGLFIEALVPPAPGRNTRVSFTVPASGAESRDVRPEHTVTAWVRVLRVQPGEGMGVRFLDIEPESRRFIGAFVRRTIEEMEILGDLAAALDGAEAEIDEEDFYLEPPIPLTAWLSGDRAIAPELPASAPVSLRAEALLSVGTAFGGALHAAPSIGSAWADLAVDRVRLLMSELAKVKRELADDVRESEGQPSALRSGMLAEQVHMQERELELLVREWKESPRGRRRDDVCSDARIAEALKLLARHLRREGDVPEVVAQFAAELEPWEVDLVRDPVAVLRSGRGHAAASEQELAMAKLTRGFVGLRLVVADGVERLGQPDGAPSRFRRERPLWPVGLRAFAYRHLAMTEVAVRESSRRLARPGGPIPGSLSEHLMVTRQHTLRSVFALRALFERFRSPGDRTFFAGFEDPYDLALALKAIETQPVPGAGGEAGTSTGKGAGRVLRWLGL